MGQIPVNFEPLFRTSPFLDLLGPIYQCKKEDRLQIGLHVTEKHCNARQGLHGVISTLADIALGYNTAFAGEQPIPIATTSLTIDYISKVKLGDWLVAYTEVQKVGRSLAFANCYFEVGNMIVARASAVFSVIR